MDTILWLLKSKLLLLPLPSLLSTWLSWNRFLKRIGSDSLFSFPFFAFLLQEGMILLSFFIRLSGFYTNCICRYLLRVLFPRFNVEKIYSCLFYDRIDTTRRRNIVSMFKKTASLMYWLVVLYEGKSSMPFKNKNENE